MANKNISDLPAGTPALADLIEILQGGVNKQATAQSIAQLTFLGSNFTSAQVLANFPAATYAGCSVYVTDLACTLVSDGIRWNVIGTPAIPPGAALLGYKTNVYTVIPSLAELNFTSTTDARIYNGCTILGPANPNAATYSTAANGQLQVSWNTGANNGSGLCTQRNINSVSLVGNLGSLPYLLGSQGFYTEIAATVPGNNATDNWFSYYLEPQEHNTTHLDSNPAFPPNYSQWHEFDINENGHGTDLGGASRGAYHQWSGTFNAPFALTAPPLQGATSVTLAAPWPGETSSPGHGWTIKLSTGESHFPINLVQGSAGPYTISAVVNTGNTATATISFNSLIAASNVQTAPLDYTVEHIFGGAYDPIGQTFTWWLDGVQQGTVSTANVNSSNTFRDTLHYFPLITMQSRGANIPFVANVRYFSAWAP